METATAIGEATRIVEEASEVPYRAMETTDKAVEMVKLGCGTIAIVDQAMNKVCGAPSEASDGHSGNVEGATMLPARKGKASRRHHLKVMKVRRSTMSNLKTSMGSPIT